MELDEGPLKKLGLGATLVGAGMLANMGAKHPTTQPGGKQPAAHAAVGKQAKPGAREKPRHKWSTWNDEDAPVRTGYSSDRDDIRVGTSSVGTERAQLQAYVGRVSKQLGIAPAFVDAIIRVESQYNPRAVSSAGALGMMQMIPATGRLYGLKDHADFFDPAKAIPAGARHLKDLLDQFDGDYALAAAAYNAGAGAVLRFGGIPHGGGYAETEAYVPRVLHNMSTSVFPDPRDAEEESDESTDE